MNRTTSSRRKRWFFARSFARAYQEWMEKRKRRQSVALQRPLFAEALEPRVLFSAAPVPAEQEVEAQSNEQQPSAQTAELIVPQVLPPQFESGIDGIENILMEPNPLYPRASGGAGAEGLKKGILISQLIP